MSDAAGTSWLDTGARRWSEKLLAATGLGPEQVPRLVEGSEVSGTLRGEIAARWGMRPDIVVAGGGGDNAASAIGTGVVTDGSAFLSLGTSGVLFAANSDYRPAPESAVHTFCHALPGTWHQMGVILSASAALEWFARISGASPATLTSELGERLVPPGRVTFLPYLSGERTPHNDSAIRGAFDGLEHESDRASLTRAVLEGVAYALRDNLEALARAGTQLSSVTVVGGGSRSRYWVRLIATVLGLPVDVPAEGEFGAALGAARLGTLAHTGADPLAVAYPPEIAARVEPDAATHDAFGERYARFRALYASLRPLAAGEV
jgi:xylulokinase